MEFLAYNWTEGTAICLIDGQRQNFEFDTNALTVVCDCGYYEGDTWHALDLDEYVERVGKREVIREFIEKTL